MTISNLSFATAVAGWMPIGNTAAIMLSAWILARHAAPDSTTLANARFDFNLGYLASTVLALCFLIMGAAALYGAQIDLPAGGARYAQTFVDMFATVVGGWSRSLVAVAALAVMYSTLLAIIDGFPRMLQGFLAELGFVSRSDQAQRRSFLLLLLIVVLSAAGFLSFFLSSFTTFIDLVTIIGFVAAPVVAWANYLVIGGSNVPATARPGRALQLWSHGAVLALLVASLSFLYFRFLY